jgi:MOSC domain-containing protein YiiM
VGRDELLASATQTGRVERIGVRPVKRGEVTEVQTWTVGTDADHAAKRKNRGVTLIQAEHVPVIAAILGHEVDALVMRRNVVVSGINVASLMGRRFTVGKVVLEGTEACDPCEHMERILGPGGFAAMVGMGGLCARIVEGGTVHVGDEVCASS